MTDLSRRSFMRGAAAVTAAAGLKTALPEGSDSAAPLFENVVLQTAHLNVRKSKLNLAIINRDDRLLRSRLAADQFPYTLRLAACDTSGNLLASRQTQIHAVRELRNVIDISADLPLGNEVQKGGIPIRYVAALENENGSDRLYIGETGAHVMSKDSAPKPYSPSTEVPTVERDSYTRKNKDGVYEVSFDWTANPISRQSLSFEVSKTKYRVAANREERNMPTLYDTAAENSIAKRIGSAIHAATPTERAAVTSARALAQSLSYYHDRTTDGTMEYPKYIEETLVDGGGDCEDKAALLIGMLSQQPFGYRTAMVFPPDHAAVAVAADDLPKGVTGTDSTTFTIDGDTYVYIETTAKRSVGDTGDAYNSAPVAVYDGAGWKKLRAGGLVKHGMTSAKEFITGKYS